MDELIQHCVRELSYDGDFGSNFTRLQEYINLFYAHRSSSSQKVDDAYHAYVWAVLVQLPTIRVGVVPEGASTEVYIAPRKSERRKAKAKGEEIIEAAPVVLQLIPDATIRPLDELRRDYGENLRIAVDPDTIFKALTGSHIRYSKLSGMVYTALQLVSRERETGIGSVDLSRKSGYDTKACHFLVDQLLELNLVVKRSKTGVSTIVHKDLFKRDATWRSIVDEENRAREEQKRKAQNLEHEDEADREDQYDEGDRESSVSLAVQFDPVDQRHLSSMDLVRGRITTLLKNSPHGLHAANNLLPKLGFVNPNKSNRRYFIARCLNPLIRQGVIEKVKVPGKNSFVTCIRLSQESKSDGQPNHIAQDPNEDPEIGADFNEGLVVNMTPHKHIVELLAESGERGMTINDLCSALGNFDRRIIELFLGRLHKNRPPAHLGDLGVAQAVENHGRERRYRYWTVSHYQAMVTKEGIPDQSYADVNLAAAGGFMNIVESQFYDDEASLYNYINGLKQGAVAKPATAKKHRNPILPDGTIKRGRPRKSVATSGAEQETPTEAKSGRGRKRKREDDDASEVQVEASPQPTPKRKRGRPPKQKPPPEPSEPSTVVQGGTGDDGASARETRKQSKVAPSNQSPLASSGNPVATPAPKRRGRPRKHPLPSAEATAQTAEDGTPAREGNVSVGAALRDHDTLTERMGITDDGVAEVTKQSEDHIITERQQTELLATVIDANAAPSSTRGVQIRTQPTEDTEPPLGTSTSRHATQSSTSALPAIPDTPSGYEQQAVIPPAQVETVPHDPKPSRPGVPIDPTLLLEFSNNGADGGLAGEIPLEAVSHADRITSKRAQLDPLVDAPQSKRPKPSNGPEDTDRSVPSNTRLVHARRERELLRVVKDAGGIVNVSSKEFYEAHASLVETMTKAGEATSTRVGARMDKRTAEATLKELDAHGQVKVITASVRISTGTIRPIRIAYLPETSEAELQAFLGSINIQQFPPQASIKTLDEPIAFGRTDFKRIVARSSSVAQTREGTVSVHLEASRANAHPVQAAFLNDKTTVAQMYGFINGKIARARALHLWLVNFVQPEATSIHIISSRERVISFSSLLNDLPISLYCALVSSQTQNDELQRLLQSPEGRFTAVGEMPTSIRDTLQIGRWRSRERLLDILEILCRLSVVHPLVPSHSATPAIIVDPIPDHPTSFDVAPVQAWTSLTNPAYFRLSTSAPLHLWALSEDLPPLWKTVAVYPFPECSEYWTQLQLVSQDKDAVREIPLAKLVEFLAGASELGRILRRPSSWSTSYSLSSTQEAYLIQHIDLASGATPLQDETGARLDVLSATIFAPREAVMRYYDNRHDKIMRDKIKIDRRAEKAREKEAQSKATMAQRANEAKAQRERDWDDMVAKVHPDPLTDSAATRIGRIRTKFLQSSGKNHEKWEGEIADAIQESIFAAKQVLVTNRAPLARPAAVPLPLVAAAPERSVRDFIESQGPRLAPRQPVRKSKKGKGAPDDDAPKGPARRQRFQWTRDYDELARDASAIVRARCRGHHRIDLAALSQAFPAVPRNSVRQRIVHLRESPGADTYLQRLEDKWYDVWMQHRGTDALPDDDPDSPSNFDMIAHLDFLRKHVDKNALRVGFVEPSRDADFALPRDVHRLNSLWDVQERPVVAPQFDFVWSLSAEEGREKQLTQHAFTTNLPEMPPIAEYTSKSLFVADSAMKMVLSTPSELYDIGAATDLLQSVGEEPVKVATETMLARGVLSKVVRAASKSRPGRTLKISDSNQNAIGGSVPQDVFQDASALEDVLRQDDDPDAWREWSLLSGDGDMAALLDMVSHGKVEFKIDTSNPRARRSSFDWNSKKADDDDIETGIMVRILGPAETAGAAIADDGVVEGVVATNAADHGSGQQVPIDPVLSSEGTLIITQHGKGWDGDDAFCRRDTDGLVDCQACLSTAKAALVRATTSEEVKLVNEILDELHIAGEEGLGKTRIMQITEQRHTDTAWTTLDKLTSSNIPLAYWTGYASVVLVAAEYIRPWAVTISGPSGKKMAPPRRWLDVLGRRIDEVWEAALRAVIGVLLFRPGVSQAEIRWRLRSVYDRQEVNDVLRWLLKQGRIERRVDESVERRVGVGAPDDEEEKHVYWFIDEEWYDV